MTPTDRVESVRADVGVLGVTITELEKQVAARDAEIADLRADREALGETNHNLVMEVAEWREVLRALLNAPGPLEGARAVERARKLLEPGT